MDLPTPGDGYVEEKENVEEEVPVAAEDQVLINIDN
jgi:hypothetical protein